MFLKKIKLSRKMSIIANSNLKVQKVKIVNNKRYSNELFLF